MINKNKNHVTLNFSKVITTKPLIGLDKHPKSFRDFIDRKLKYFNGIITRNGGRSLISYLINFYGTLGGSLNKSRVRAICIFSFYCFKVYSNEGSKGLVMSLKTSHVLLQQAIAGYVIKDKTPLKRRVRTSRTGVPYIIPLTYRIELLNGNLGLIRFWTSLFALYRVIDCPSKVDLSSITENGPDLSKLHRSHRNVIFEVILR